MHAEKFSYQRKISRIVLDPDIPLDLVLNLDQTSPSYVSSGKYTFCLKGFTNAPIRGVMTSVKSQEHLQYLPLFFSYLFNWYKKIKPKGLYQSPDVKKNVSIYFKRSYPPTSTSEKQNLDIEKINYFLLLWTSSRIKIKKKINLYAWITIAS